MSKEVTLINKTGETIKLFSFPKGFVDITERKLQKDVTRDDLIGLFWNAKNNEIAVCRPLDIQSTKRIWFELIREGKDGIVSYLNLQSEEIWPRPEYFKIIQCKVCNGNGIEYQVLDGTTIYPWQKPKRRTCMVCLADGK